MFKSLAILATCLPMTAGVALAQPIASSDAGVRGNLTAAELKEYCVFNNKIFSQGAGICARKGIAYHCKKEPRATVATWVASPDTCVNGTELPPT